MDHVVLSADGTLPFPVSGRSAGAGRCIYLPRFDARSLTSSLPGRGFDDQLYQYPGSSYFVGVSFAEMLQRAENRITIDYTQRNAWGIPMLGIDCRHGDHELRQARDQFLALQELAKLAKVKITRIDHTPAPPGGAIHECGTPEWEIIPLPPSLIKITNVGMPRVSMLLTVCVSPSQGNQNPTLTILALTARACAHVLRKFVGNGSSMPT
jgi:hypothetical protein